MFLRRLIFPIVFVFAFGGAASAQNPVAVSTSSARALPLGEAIRLAIQNNLSAKLVSAQTEEAYGQALQEASALLPHLMGSVSEQRIFKVNFEAEGFPGNSPLLNPLIGPYNVFDARLQLEQKIFDLASIWRTRAGLAGIDVIHLQRDLVNEQLATAATVSYIEALRTQQSVAAAEANKVLADSLLTQTRDQHKTGVATGVDVARSETQAAEQNVALIRAQVASQEADLRLKRVLGVKLGDPIQLTDNLGVSPAALPSEDEVARLAAVQRVEIKVARETFRALRLLAGSAKAGYFPTISFSGDYGYSGNIPYNSALTGGIGGRLDLPIFSGGQIEGDVKLAKGQAQEAEARFHDTEAQAEEDARLSVKTLGAEQEEVQSADLAVHLAERELKMARDRFSSGVGDNIQVIEAQASLARAREEQVEALARYSTARASLAAALGQAQKFQL
jgi:outer membrane protein TolC